MIRMTFFTPCKLSEQLLTKKLPLYIMASVLFTFLLGIGQVYAQTNEKIDTAFKKILAQRSAKIVAGLSIEKEGKKNKIISIIADQYYKLNKIHDDAKLVIANIKASIKSETERTTAITKTEEAREKNLSILHKQFIKKLNKKMSEEQVDKVKNGMTFNVLNVTYAAYEEMILSLTKEQKAKIYAWLVEAREKAMDQGSSDDKHKVFGKYKGRINNYLSAEGYDMKAEEKAWQQRLREKRAGEVSEKLPQST